MLAPCTLSVCSYLPAQHLLGRVLPISQMRKWRQHTRVAEATWLKAHEATVWGEGAIWGRQAFPNSLH